MLFILALPLLAYLSFKPKYKQSIPARFFLFKNNRFHRSKEIWFHLCSYGEAIALKPILDLIPANSEIAISTITQTGFSQAKKYKAEVRYLPYEMYLPFWIRKHKVLVVLEAEFWYMLFTVAFAKGTKIILLNARIPDKSVQSYMKYRWFYKRMLKKVAVVFVQSEIDKERFKALGAKNIHVIGNIKLAGDIIATQTYPKPDNEVIVAGSTHETEEEIVLDAYVKYKKEYDAKLIIVPRHPERFESVYQLMQKYAKEHQLTLSKFSEDKTLGTDMILVDMMGELNNIYKISDVAILGGAFKDDVGGHNPLEPAFFGCKIISGKHYFNLKELFKYVENIQYIEPSELIEALVKARDLSPSKVEEKIDLEPVINTIKKYMKEN